MIMLSLNIKGMGSGEKITELKKLLRKEKVQVLALQETLLGEEIGDEFKHLRGNSEMGFAQQLTQGRSGGLLFL